MQRAVSPCGSRQFACVGGECDIAFQKSKRAPRILDHPTRYRRVLNFGEIGSDYIETAFSKCRGYAPPDTAVCASHPGDGPCHARDPSSSSRIGRPAITD